MCLSESVGAMVLGGGLPKDVGAPWIPFGDASRSYEVQMQVGVAVLALKSKCSPAHRLWVLLRSWLAACAATAPRPRRDLCLLARRLTCTEAVHRILLSLAVRPVLPASRTMARSWILAPRSHTYPRRLTLLRGIISAPSVRGVRAQRGLRRASIPTTTATQ
jgi:hypothetical protein